MEWIELTHPQQLQEVIEVSQTEPVFIFKHSTTCSISRMALDRLERQWKPLAEAPGKGYFLDLLAHRPISNQIADLFGVRHESPQVLVIKNGKAVYHESHYGISYPSLRAVLVKN